MATKFDSKEYAKKRLLTLCEKYFPSDLLKITKNRKGFKLGESTQELIQEAIRIVEKARENGEVLPRSTVDIYRYGKVIKEVFENLPNFQTISQIKSRSRRGYRKHLEVVDFDLRKIEYELKKSPNPHVKMEKDEKIVNRTKKDYLGWFNEGKYEQISQDLMVKQKIFVIEDIEGKKFFLSFSRIFNNFLKINKEAKDLENRLGELKQAITNLEKSIHTIKEIESSLLETIEEHREKYGVIQLIKEKERLLNDPKLSLFLRTITTAIERYIKMMERRENKKIEKKEEFMGFITDPLRYDGFDEEMWREIVFIIETHGVELLSSKYWFNFNDSRELRDFLLSKDNLTKYARLRRIEKEVESIENQLLSVDDYKKAYTKLKELDEYREKLKEYRKEKEILEQRKIAILNEISNEKEKVLQSLL
ncbi:MAG: hypothetical protein ACTSR2_14825 [Candidatus Hodarchaeales archaeon]